MDIVTQNAARFVYVLVACSLVVPLSAGAQNAAPLKLTYVDLVSRLTDLDHLATLPLPGEKCVQWSSWDRASQYDAASGKYVNWDANGDGNGIIRKEGDELVFAEIEGPAVIWRTWSALAKEGHVKIYLDGQTTPVVDLPFIGYFNGENAPFTYPALVHEAARGQNCYVPIPFQKSCKITASGDWGAYYHFTYTTYPKGTILPTFTRDLSEEELHALDRANTVLSRRGSGPIFRRTGQKKNEKEVTLLPGKTVTVLQLDGKQAITGIDVSLPVAPGDLDTLRELTLHIYWDGESQPSVWSPLGDFFGSAPGVNKYESYPLGMVNGTFFCRWYMPFERGAQIKVTNDGAKERKINFAISHAPLTQPIETLGRFHAKWHRDAFLPTDVERKKIDWTMLKTEGRGRFCGVMLHVWNPRGGWWGEGDEKFFVDGEKFPSTFGTGSEDYFGYAWCDPGLFENCYHNQTLNTGNNKGHISVNRWHITDNVPFEKSFEAAIEKY
ncbi:MAG: glycoside hydrolase family 172 protein, partial [Solirubrobacterales bacterium]